MKLGLTLDAEPRKSIGNIYSRHRKSFFIGIDTAIINLMTPSGAQETRVFSERGSLKVARYSDTKKADQIIDEVFDVFLEAKKIQGSREVPIHIISREFCAAKKLAKSAGIKEGKAIKLADSLVKKQLGVSPLDLLEIDRNELPKYEKKTARNKAKKAVAIKTKIFVSEPEVEKLVNILLEIYQANQEKFHYRDVSTTKYSQQSQVWGVFDAKREIIFFIGRILRQELEKHEITWKSMRVLRLAGKLFCKEHITTIARIDSSGSQRCLCLKISD